MTGWTWSSPAVVDNRRSRDSACYWRRALSPNASGRYDFDAASVESRERVLVVEDVITTGGSTRETVDAAINADGVVIGAGSIVDRSGGSVDVGVRRQALLTLEVPSYEASVCPLCKDGVPPIKPGSRGLKQ